MPNTEHRIERLKQKQTFFEFHSHKSPGQLNLIWRIWMIAAHCSPMLQATSAASHSERSRTAVSLWYRLHNSHTTFLARTPKHELVETVWLSSTDYRGTHAHSVGSIGRDGCPHQAPSQWKTSWSNRWLAGSGSRLIRWAHRDHSLNSLEPADLIIKSSKLINNLSEKQTFFFKFFS